MKVALCIVIVISTVFMECYGDSVNVTGQLFCDGTPVANVEVDLRDHDTISPDDSLQTTKSDYFGIFKLNGEESENGKVEFYIRIQHSCDAKEKCTRQTDYQIPKRRYETFYDLGPINLKPFTKRDEDKC
ncbi:transthyretin-like family domain-containing protein [Ditylenchus destructor]|nr:transthyretin-like family domain-containing protein [Ditylenchus destructor]